MPAVITYMRCSQKFIPLAFLYVFTNCFLFSCQHQIPPESGNTLYERYRKSVVLIRNRYYYEINFNNGPTAYFTRLKNGEIADLSFDEKEAEKNALITYGTGFFISRDGKVATNRHIVSPDLNEQAVLLSLKSGIAKMQMQDTGMQQKLALLIAELDSSIHIMEAKYPGPSIEPLKESRRIFNKESDRLKFLTALYNLDPASLSIKAKCVSLGIAFDKAFINKEADFKECVIVQKSPASAIDLAIIQLKDQKTPRDIPFIFDFENHNPNAKKDNNDLSHDSYIDTALKTNAKIFMIGFNDAFKLADTPEGLKAQSTEGTVSQETDQYRVLYSAPSLQGSSGSPVYDEWGNLVAINFGRVSNTQNFNYGVKAKHLRDLVARH